MTTQRKKTNYLFLTSSSNVVEAKGWDVHEAKRDAERQIAEIQQKMIDAGASDWKYLPRVISYDTFNRDGISFRMWKKIPMEKKTKDFIKSVNLGSSSHYGDRTAQVTPKND